MCGIAGYVGDDRLAHVGLELALKSLHHRGPNDTGQHVSGPVSMGMTRLSIIDLAGGHQPIYNEDGTIAVVFNGEIYNHRELGEQLRADGHTLKTSSDTEVLVHLYEQYGESMATHLRGMFAFAIHDGRTDTVVLGRDRFGKKPLYYPHDGSELWFGSELKSIVPWARTTGRSLDIDAQGVYDYLSLGVVPHPTTVFTGVRALPPATTATLRRGALTFKSYWSPTFSPKTELSLEEAAEETRRLVREAVTLRLRSEVPLGVFLSGGVDSSVVAYEAAQVLGGDLETFTIATGDALDESAIAQDTARGLGVRNTTLPLAVDPVRGVMDVVARYDQPFADSSAIPSLQVADLAAEHVTVALNGDGGDELFAGYRRHVAAQRLGRFNAIPNGLTAVTARALEPLGQARRSRLGLVARFARGMSLGPEERYLVFTTDMLREDDKRLHWVGGDAQPTERLVDLSAGQPATALDRQMANDVRINLLSDLLVKMDMACMAASLEARSPFMDHVLAEFAFTLPDSLRIGPKGRSKHVLKEAYRGRIPTQVLNGAKKGFEVPMERWLAVELREMVQDTLGGSDSRVSAFVDDHVRLGLVRGNAYADRNTGYLLYALLVLELWLRHREVNFP